MELSNEKEDILKFSKMNEINEEIKNKMNALKINMEKTNEISEFTDILNCYTRSLDEHNHIFLQLKEKNELLKESDIPLLDFETPEFENTITNNFFQSKMCLIEIF